jgi:hypothetical protein
MAEGPEEDPRRPATEPLVPVVCEPQAITGEAVWAQLSPRRARERPVLMRGYLQQLEPREVARLLELSEAGARHEVLKRVAQLDGLRHR